MMLASLDRGPVAAEERERAALRELDEKLSRAPGQEAMLIGPNGEELRVPVSAYVVLARVIHEMARGRAVTVAPLDKELSTNQAAELLNVSRPHLVNTLLGSAIPYYMVGTHRRVKLQDALAYRQQRDREAREALGEMAAAAQELGLYEE
jgi:excisionase family DNA binding protein